MSGVTGAGSQRSALDQILPSAEPPYPGWQRPGPGPDGLRADLVGAVALAVAAVVTMPLYPWAGLLSPAKAPLWLELLWSVAVTLPLAWRRRYPMIIAIVVSALYMAGGIAFGVALFFPMIALFVAFYTVGAWESDRQRARWTRIGITAVMFVWLIISIFVYATGDQSDTPAATGPFSPLVSLVLIQLLTNATFFIGSYYLGNRGFAQAVGQDVLEQRTAELARERERSTAQALALERMRIARELHDVVAHHVSVMGVEASAARVAFDQNPAAARQALGHVESSARTAIDELHGMLSTLRYPDPDASGGTSTAANTDAAATVGVRQLSALVEQSQLTGLPTRLEIIGEPVPLPSVLDVNIYRIVQEALTNVRKHAGPRATADVRLRYYADEVEVEVTNSGAAPPRRVMTGAGAGLGQLGMRERVAASGGTIEFGALARGGYLVRARMPRSDRPSVINTGAAS